MSAFCAPGVAIAILADARDLQVLRDALRYAIAQRRTEIECHSPANTELERAVVEEATERIREYGVLFNALFPHPRRAHGG